MNLDIEKFLQKAFVGTKHIDQALICRKQDCAVWASTPDFKLRMYTIPFDDRNGEKTEKLINEAAIVARLAHTLLTPTEGVRINGLKYIPVRTFPNGTENDGLGTIHLKRIFGGGCICVTKKALVMATFDEGKGQTATQCNLYVERAGRYLLNQEY